jgi:hypothetical protein
MRANDFVIVGKYKNAVFPATIIRGVCSAFADGKIRALTSCVFLESQTARWMSSGNGRLENNAVVRENQALGRALNANGLKIIGRIISTPTFAGLIYTEGGQEFKVTQYEALVCSC